MTTHAGSTYLPTLDLSRARAGDSSARAEIAQQIDRACRETGFFLVVGHGIDQSLIDRQLEVTHRLFALPAEQKLKWEMEPGDVTMRGVSLKLNQAGSGALRDRSKLPSDLCEHFAMSRLGEPGVAEEAGLGADAATWGKPNRWPDVDGFREAWLAMYAAVEALAWDLMRLFALALELPEDHFDPLTDQHISNFAANYYPPVKETLPGQFRKGPHTDSGTMTILYQDAPGLQVRDRRSGEWIDVPLVPGAFVVNIADLMAIWTNDRWVSTHHRLLAPTGAAALEDRVSVAMFFQPNWTTLVECLPTCMGPDNPAKHEPVRSGDYLGYRTAPLLASSRTAS